MTGRQKSVKVTELKLGDKIRVKGRDTRGWDTVREGYLVAGPKNVQAQWNLGKREAVRLHVDKNKDGEPSRQNWTTVLPECTAELLDGEDA